ncbi:MAG: hypothetical protein ABI670_16515 [Chloroflexota bacterium]
MQLRVRRTINSVITIGVVGIVVLLLGLLLPAFAEFITYIYVVFAFALILYRIFTFLPRRAISLITRAAIVGILVGLGMMIQPFVFELFRWGFYLLLLSTLTYSVVSYVRPTSSLATSRDLLEEMPVSISAAESSLPTTGGTK